MDLANTSACHKIVPILFERQRQLLTLLDELGGFAGNLDFQKLLFLYCQEPHAAGLYEFVPYRFGAFSFTSYADRRKLVERGFLANDEHWRLTEEGKKAIRSTRRLGVSTFVRRYCSLRGDALVAETYRRFPFYAIRSEIVERVLWGDAAALRRIAAVRPDARGAAIFTIGYEGRSIESYLNALLRAAVTLLCDVRQNPVSRKYGFSKSTLAKGCEGIGIRYEHLPELGIASERRRSLETQEDYDALFDDYQRRSLPKQRGALAKIAAWVRAEQRVALTCYERALQRCHRRCVAEALERELGKGFAVEHL